MIHAPLHSPGAVLRKIDVRSAIAPLGKDGRVASLVTVQEDTSLKAILECFSDCDQAGFPVLNDKGELTGVLDGGDIRRVLGEDALADPIVARDLARKPATLTPDDDLRAAVETMTLDEMDELVIVDAKDATRPIAVLNHNSVVRAYDRALFSSQG